jgi:thiamine-monophosphate kinase
LSAVVSNPATIRRRFGEGGPTLAEAGEPALLRLLSEMARALPGEGLLVPSGDDAAVWRPPAGTDLAVSQDAMVEGQDFERPWITPWQLGRRALNAALSDLAGMGARPAWCTSTLCAPASTQVEDVAEIQAGLCEAALAAGCAVAGGDVSEIDGPLVLDVTVAGTAAADRFLRRDRGDVGDALLVTGTLGSAAAGLSVLRGEPLRAREEDRLRWLAAFLDPQPRLTEGAELVERGVVCGGDLSDGLLADVARTTRASGCGAELWLDVIPKHPSLRDCFGARWPELALGGGEDFELLATVPAREAPRFVREWPGYAAPLSIVGRLVAPPGLRLLDRKGGREVPLPPIVSRHYA